MTCRRCRGYGFLNADQVPFSLVDKPIEQVLNWMHANDNHDVQVCDCCGDGESWYGIPGQHYNNDDAPGDYGYYGYNGGLAECH